MLQYVVALFCFLWFLRVWLCLFGTPVRLLGRVVVFAFQTMQACYTKVADVAEYTRVQRQKAAQDTDHLKK